MKPNLLLIWLCLFACTAQGQGIILDTTFGNKGYVTKHPEGQNDYLNESARAAAELPDGKLLVLIQTDRASYLVRLLTDGTIDNTYGTTGMSDQLPVSEAKLLQTKDGQVYVAGTHVSSESEFVVLHPNANGRLDKQFGKEGLLVIPGLERQAQVTGFIAQEDGKLLLAGVDGYAYYKGKGRIFRILTNGTLDATYANGGILNVDVDDLTYLWDIALNGKGIVVGTTTFSSNFSLNQAIVAFNEQGKRVEDFGTAGKIVISIASLGNGMHLATQSNGRILFATNMMNYQSFHDYLRIYAYQPNGQVDETFHGNGVTDFDPVNQNQGLTSLYLDKNDRIYLTGNLASPDFQQFQLFSVRFDQNGNPDGNYGAAGWATVTGITNQEVMYGGLLTANGSVVAAGRSKELPSMNYMVAKITSSGKPDNGFGSAGFVEGYFPSSISQFTSLRALPNGQLFSRIQQRGYYTIYPPISKYLANGTPDLSAGYEGNFYVEGYDFDLLPGGVLLTLDRTINYAEAITTLKLRRYNSIGQTDFGYGVGGVTQIPFNDYLDVSKIIALPDSAALVLGVIYDNSGGSQWLLIKVTPEGKLDTGFGQNGVIWVSKEAAKQVKHVTVQSDGKILVSGPVFIEDIPNPSLFIHRYNKDGSPDLQFGHEGIVRISGVPAFEGISALPLSNGKIVFQAIARGTAGADKTMVYGFNNDGTPSPEIGTKELPFLITIPLVELPNGNVLAAGGAATGTTTSGVFYEFRPGGDEANDKTTYVNLDGDGSTFTEMVANKEGVWLTGTKYAGFDEIGFLTRYNYNTNPTVSVTSLTLVNAINGKDIQELKDGDRINMAQVGRILNVRATTDPGQTGSVVFSLTGNESHQQTENLLPYALFGDYNGNYRNWQPQPGNYTLTATPFSKAGGKGTAGTPLSLSFTLVDSLTLSQFVLVDAQKDRSITAIAPGATHTVDLSRYPHLNLKVTPGAGLTESVRFVVNGKEERVENATPFALASNNRGDFFDWKVTPGTYVITAIPYAKNNAAGKEGTPITITLNVVDGAVVTSNAIATRRNTDQITGEAKLTLSVYPNPVVSNGTIRFGSSGSTYGTVRLLTEDGNVVRQVFSGALAGGIQTLNVDVSSLPRGIYFWQLYTADGKVITRKMIH